MLHFEHGEEADTTEEKQYNTEVLHSSWVTSTYAPCKETTQDCTKLPQAIVVNYIQVSKAPE